MTLQPFDKENRNLLPEAQLTENMKKNPIIAEILRKRNEVRSSITLDEIKLRGKKIIKSDEN